MRCKKDTLDTVLLSLMILTTVVSWIMGYLRLSKKLGDITEADVLGIPDKIHAVLSSMEDGRK